jgi:quercetin dioxygenase-like cupin family protein
MTLKSPRPIRRVVTGHDEKSVAKVLIDGEATNTRSSQPGRFSTLIWSTDATPVDNVIGEDIEDLGARKLGTAPPAGGTRFTVNDIPPGARGAMHRTETLDYVIVLSGELDMELDDGMVTLRAGEVMVQRGTNHAWINRGSDYARVAFVLIDANPLGIGRPLTGMATNKTGPL